MSPAPASIEGPTALRPERGPAPLTRVWTGLNYPRGLALSPAGELYLIDKSGWIRALDPEGRERARAQVPAIAEGSPSALAWHPEGLLLVANSHYGEVLCYDSELRLLTRWGSHGHAPGRFMLLTGIAADAAGRVYVSDQGDDVARVQVFTREGEYLRSFGRFGSLPGDFNRPMGIAVAGQELAVADSLNHRVQIFDLEGRLLRRFGLLGEAPGDLKYPYGLSFDSDGGLFVADFGNHRIQRFDRLGQLLGSFGRPGRELRALRSPWCVLTGGGRVFVADGGNDRIYELPAAAFGD